MDLAPRHPLDVLGGLRDRWEIRRDQRRPQPDGVQPVGFDEAVAGLGSALGSDLAAPLAEPGLQDLEAEVEGALGRTRSDGPYPTNWNASRALARTAYAVVRAQRPAVVVEVGVAAGLSSAFICAGLEANGEGHLHSIDPVLGGEDAEREIGLLVPARLRHRRTLHRGRSRRLLPRLLGEHAPSMVLLDGMHTEPTMRWEIGRAGGALPGGGVLLVDDAERNPAFAGWAQGASPGWWALVQTEHAGHVFGAAVI